MKQAVLGNLLRIVPKNLMSYVVGLLAHAKLPWPLGPFSVRWFAQRYNINMSEAEKPLEAYASIGTLFTRHLRPGARPIGEGMVSPADGQLTTVGPIHQGRLYQAKGKYYSIVDFLGDSEGVGSFEGGTFLTYYLCPTDYHRVHSPVKGEITRCIHLPGRLWPVNPWSVSHISQLFAVNERVAIWMETERGPVVVVMVGATNVGKMTMSFDPRIVTNQSHNPGGVFPSKYSKPIAVEKGEELGVFHMGSTAVVLCPQGYFSELPKGKRSVKMGESIEDI